MKYSIIIPTYNHCDDLLIPCVESIFKYSNITDIELIISANGCKDNTKEYLDSLKDRFNSLGLGEHIKVAWSDDALGYSRACNAGIEVATTDYIVLLNNDTVLLEQTRNRWLELLVKQFEISDNCGISCLIKSESAPAGHDFAIFFCVMIHRKVFDKIGLLSLDYGAGGGEDTEFSIECERAGFEVRECVDKAWAPGVGMYSGDFPIYHVGEGTVHDKNLVPEWDSIFLKNSLTLAKKYNMQWYKWRISNNSERGVFFKGDEVFARERTRYLFAAQNLVGKKVLEIGCSSGFGLQFLPEEVDYTGIDNDAEIIVAAQMQNWRPNAKFMCADINTVLETLGKFDTIIAFESIEHIPNGLPLVEKLKSMCDKLIVTVPYNENPGQFSPHHHLFNLTVDKFAGFTQTGLIDINGNIINTSNVDPNTEYNLLMVYEANKIDYKQKLSFLKDQHEEIYDDVVIGNSYDVVPADFVNRTVIDIGANIGTFALIAAELGAKQIFAVEPVKDTFNTLLSNIVRTGHACIIPLKKVVTDKSGETFNISLKSNSGHNSMYNITDTFETVPTITLHDLMQKTSDDNILLKVDCEGAEYDILLSASVEDMNRINKVILEIHMELHPVHRGFEILHEKMTAFGFSMITEKQIYSWFTDAQGNRHDMKPIPYRTEVWERTTVSVQAEPVKETNLEFLKEQDIAMYNEVIAANQYHLSEEKMRDRTVIDIGANIGAFSLYAASLGAKNVISVEPISASYNTFLGNIYRTGLTTITTLKKLISEQARQFIRVSLNDNAGANSMYNVSDNYEVVETTTFSDLMHNIPGNDILLKLDCEGAEYDIIMNARTEDMRRVNEIMLEIHTELHPKYKGRQVIEDKLKEFGFTNLDTQQIYYYDFDAQGNKINWREAPYSNQHWKK